MVKILTYILFFYQFINKIGFTLKRQILKNGLFWKRGGKITPIIKKNYFLADKPIFQACRKE